MTQILFSIPAHERADTVLDTIQNSRRMNGEGHSYMIHASANWGDFDPDALAAPDIYFNPYRFATQHAHCQIPTHITNFMYAEELGIDFTHMAVLHTSELFVRPGMPEHIRSTDHSLWFTPDNQPAEMTWPPFHNAYMMAMFGDLFNPRMMENYLGNLIEGSWWSRKLFGEITEWTNSHYNVMGMNWDWAAEECYFPTLSWHLSGGKNFLHPYCAFYHADHYLQRTDFVDDIRAGNPVTFWQPHNFVYNYEPFPSQGLFSVKRINRELDDPMRVYINQLAP